MTEQRGRFRRVVSAFKEGLQAAKDERPEPGERFVMKAGEVTILPQGGAKIARKPGEKRAD